LDARGLIVDLDASLAARRLPQPDSQTHRVDLSCLLSRYIGETEKNLGAVFSDAQPGRALLEYDESSSLFGKR
jgi:SpoVK/Ycf46/Vps4 family AAA+-type ATPase